MNTDKHRYKDRTVTRSRFFSIWVHLCSSVVAILAFSGRVHAVVSGDCNGDARVAIGELIIAVNIELGTRPLADCTAADADGDGTISIAALVTDVRAALGLVTATPTPGRFVDNQRIVYMDGLHNENTEMIRLGDRIVLVFRGGETGQVGSAKAHINVYE